MVEAVTAELEPMEGVDEPRPDPTGGVSRIPTRHEMNMLIEYALSASKSGCGSQESCLLKMLVGREVGISPAISLSEIDLIPSQNGVKASLNARTQIALIRRRQLGDVRLVESTDEHAVVEAWRADDGRRFRFRFTTDEAKRAGLLTKNNWRNWPSAMLLARVQSKATKALFQEVFLGLCYTPDELGADTDEDGRPQLTLAGNPGSGIELKKEAADPRLKTEDVARVANEAAAAVEPASEPAPPAEDVQRFRDQVKALVQHVLTLQPDEWRNIRGRFGHASEALTLDQLKLLKQYLSDIALLRRFREELDVPDDKWSEALRKRGALRDTELSWKAAAEFADKLAANLTPFSRSRITNALLRELGDPALNDEGPGGNGH